MADSEAAEGQVATLPSVDMAREVVRLAELYLDGTLRLAIAADSRAMQLSGLTATAATALFGVGVTYASHNHAKDVVGGIAAICAGAVFYVAAWCALRAASPRPFNVVGNLPSSWRPDELRSALPTVLLSQAEVYELEIQENLATLIANAKRTTLALRLVIFAPASALLIFAIAFLMNR